MPHSLLQQAPNIFPQRKGAACAAPIFVELAAAAVVVAAAAVSYAAAAVAAATEEDKKDKYDPKTRVVTTVVTAHKNTPFRRCAGC